MNTPLLTYFGVSQRSPRLVEMYRHDALPIVGYQFWGHSTPDGAYGDVPQSDVGGDGATFMFAVTRGQQYRSPGLRRRGLGFFETNRRGQTTVFFDPEDYTTPGGDFGMDEDWLFVRVQENRLGSGLLAYPTVPEATVTLATVGVGDQLIVKGVYFQFAAGANNLAGKAGTAGDPFLVGLGGGDNDAAANLTLALNDAGDVAPVMDALAPLNTRTFATNTGAPSAVVVIQPEDVGGDLIPGSSAAFAISTPDDPRVSLDVDSAAAGTLVSSGTDATNPVLGPIYCVPPAVVFANPALATMFTGTAPAATGCSVGEAPNLKEDLTDASPRPMHLVFPRPLSAFTFLNQDAANDALVSFGPTMPMVRVKPGDSIYYSSGEVKQILIAGRTDAVEFRIQGAMAPT